MKGVGTYVAMTDIMTNFAIVILLLATPFEKTRDDDSQYSYWIRSQTTRKFDVSEAVGDWNVTIRHNSEDNDWKFFYMQVSEPDYVGFCTDKVLIITEPKSASEVITFDDLPNWLDGLYRNDEILLFELVDGDCRHLVDNVIDLQDPLGNIHWMHSPPEGFSDWYRKMKEERDNE